MNLRPWLAWSPVIGLLLATGCVGRIDESAGDPLPPTSERRPLPPADLPLAPTPPGATGSSAPSPSAADPAPGTTSAARPGAAGLRRLTRPQLENSLRDLLGGVRLGEVEPDAWQDGFASIGAATSSVSPAGVEQYETAIGAAVDEVFANPTRRAAFVGCSPSGPGDAACMRTFVAAFGRRAWRGPLEPAAVTRFVDLGVGIAGSLGDFFIGARHAAAALLQSPQFLYRIELATVPDPADPRRRRFSSRAIASRLSYLLWNTTPDAELLAAVDRDELATAAGVRAQAERLLRSPRALAAMANFAEELFHLHRLDTLPKDTKLYPQLTPALRRAMAGEVTRLFQRLLERDIDAMELFDTAEVAVTAELAMLYGLPEGTAKGTTFTAATLPVDGVRAGVLGTAAILALHAKQGETSPTARGRLVRETFLCQPVPDPPPEVDTGIKDPPAGVVLTTRQKFEIHREDPTCAACHALLDPAGFALESFDAVGAFRALDHGKPIDPRGVLDGQPFAHARDLGRILRGSPAARRCLVRQLYRYAVAHRESSDEEGFISELDAAFQRGDGRMKALLLAMTASDAFRHASAP